MKKLFFCFFSVLIFLTGCESSLEKAARESVCNNLKAPSTAKFIEVKVFEKKLNYTLVKVSCDAQNSYGAFIRNNYLVAIKNDNKKCLGILDMSDYNFENSLRLLKLMLVQNQE